MNKSITIDLDYDTIDRITTSSMRSVLENLEMDLQKRKNDSGMAIFVQEQQYDIILLEKHIEALKLILEYYDESKRI
jgi:transcription initiation factor IIE alpha subunit